uniref:Uncharacterized protein n=1 Tax=Salvator merianae TaxID=96440 RepID=A0A8D0EED4_SALMN
MPRYCLQVGKTGRMPVKPFVGQSRAGQGFTPIFSLKVPRSTGGLDGPWPDPARLLLCCCEESDPLSWRCLKHSEQLLGFSPSSQLLDET